jgi:hypothetical protein
MPRIKLTQIVAGPDYRGQPGEIIEVPNKDAQQLIKAQAAIAQEPDGEPEKPAETETSNSGSGLTMNVEGDGTASTPATETSSGGMPPPGTPAGKPPKPSKKTK